MYIFAFENDRSYRIVWKIKTGCNAGVRQLINSQR